ncbi:MAG: hypothetical protein KA419_00525 [Acidobacteria bacterium]|nr:hypothetical protein [Acidobacteriota bacterium]
MRPIRIAVLTVAGFLAAVPSFGVGQSSGDTPLPAREPELGGQTSSQARTPLPLELPEELPVTWELIHDVLEKMGYEVDSEDRGEGRITTREDAGISGASALATLKKIATVATDFVSSFHEARYTLEIRVAFLQPQRTTVSVFAAIQGLKRALDGTETWVRLDSIGTLERRMLNEISFAATGKRPYHDPLPYWKKRSQEISIKQ